MAREKSKTRLLDKAMFHGVDFKVTVDSIPGTLASGATVYGHHYISTGATASLWLGDRWIVGGPCNPVGTGGVCRISFSNNALP